MTYAMVDKTYRPQGVALYHSEEEIRRSLEQEGYQGVCPDRDFDDIVEEYTENCISGAHLDTIVKEYHPDGCELPATDGQVMLALKVYLIAFDSYARGRRDGYSAGWEQGYSHRDAGNRR